jgi:Rrf2 family protein
MKLSSRARYALRAMIAITRLSEDSAPVSLDRVAQRTRVSKRYLEQLAIALKHSSLLIGVSGKGGGYRLARPAAEIKVGEIIEAAIGPINIVSCVRHPDACLMVEVCECRLFYLLLNRRISEVLNEFSLHDLADKGWLKKMSQELEAFDRQSRELEARPGPAPASTRRRQTRAARTKEE